MSHAQHIFRNAFVLVLTGWIAYTCFKRAITPPKDKSMWWHHESYRLNKNPLVRLLNVLGGILILAIGIGVVFGQ